MSPEELLAYRRQLAQATLSRAPKGGGGALGSLGRVGDLLTPDLVGLAMRQIGEALLYTPAGVVQMMDAVRKDYITDPIREIGRGEFEQVLYPENLAGIGKESGKQVYEDFRHPLRNPGYLAMDLFGIASSGAGAVGKISLAAKAAKAAGSPQPGPLLGPDEVVPGGPRFDPRFPGQASPPAMFPTPSEAAQTVAAGMRESQAATAQATSQGGFLSEMTRYASGETPRMAWRATPEPTVKAVDATPPGRASVFSQVDPDQVSKVWDDVKVRSVGSDVERALTARTPLDNKTLQKKLDFLEQQGYTAMVEDGRFTLLHPSEGTGAKLRDAVDEAYAAENVYKGLAASSETSVGEARGAFFSQRAMQQAARDMADWQRTNPGEPWPPTHSMVSDDTLSRLSLAERRAVEWEARNPKRTEATAARETGEEVPYPIADETTGRPKPPLTAAQEAAHEKRLVAQRRKQAKDAGFPNTAAAARSMGQVRAVPISPEGKAAAQAQRVEADFIANDPVRVDARALDETSGHVYVDGKPSGVLWQQNPKTREWEVVAHDRKPHSSAKEIDDAITMWMQEEGLVTGKNPPRDVLREYVERKHPGGLQQFLHDRNLVREIAAKDEETAKLWARRDAVEKVLQEKEFGHRSLDLPEIPTMQIDGKPITVRAAVELGRKAEAEKTEAQRKADREAEAAETGVPVSTPKRKVSAEDAVAAAAEAEARRQKAIAALGIDDPLKGPDPEAPLPPEVREVLKDESPPEIHDLLDELEDTAEAAPLVEKTEAPTVDQIDRELRDMEPEEILSDAEMMSLLDEGDGDWLGPTIQSDNPFDWNPDEASLADAGEPSGPTPVEHQGDFKADKIPGAPPGRPGTRTVQQKLVDDLIEAAASEPPPVSPGTRGSGRTPRELKASVGDFRRLGYEKAEAEILSKTLMAALRDAGATKDSEPSVFKAAIAKALKADPDNPKHMDDVDEVFNRLHLAPKPRVVPTREPGLQGSFRQTIEKVLGSQAMTPEQFDELAGRIKPRLQEEFKQQGGASPRRLHEILVEETTKEFGDLLFSKLYKVTGGSGESAARVFIRALFEPSPRQTAALVRPGWEEITKKQHERLHGARGPEVKAVRNTDGSASFYRRVTKETQANISVNPIRAGFQRFLYEYGVNRAPEYSKDLGATDRMRARYAEHKFRFEEEERSRLRDYMGADEEERKGAISGDLAPGQTPKPRGPGAWIDSMNQLATLLTLYVKPGYVPPNMIGQVLFSTIDSAWNPIALARSYRFHRDVRQGKLGEERTTRLHELLGTGMYESIRPQRGAVESLSRVTGKFANSYAKFMDTPFREAAFYNEAYRAGFRTTSQIEKLLDAKPGSSLYEDLITVGQNANRNIVDYSRLNKVEKTAIRRIVFFYPWIKGSTMYTARFASEHPFQFTAASQSARVGQERAEEVLGQVPSYLKGLIPLGEHDVPGLGKLPTVMNPGAVSIFGSAGQAVNAARGFAFGDVRAGEQLSEYFTPALTAGVAAATRVDPFTGARYKQGVSPLEIGLKELSETVAPYRAYEKWKRARQVQAGTKDPSEMLFPSTPQQEAMSYVAGSMWPRTYNLKEGQERAAAETLGLESKQKQTQIKWNDRTRVAAQEAKRVGLKMDKAVADAFKAKAERAAEYDQFASSIGKKERDLSPIERLQADMGLLVRRGIYTEAQAKQLLSQYSGLERSAISSFRTKLHRAYMGQALLTDFKSRMLNSGADPNLVDTDL